MQEGLDNHNEKRVVAYIRKSTEDTEDIQTGKKKSRRQVNSDNYQRAEIDRVKKEYNLMEVKLFKEHHSAYRAFERVEFDKMLHHIEDNSDDIDGIIVFDISRLARNFGDGGYILWYLQSGLINRVYTHDKVFTHSSSDQLMIAIQFALSKYSSDETSKRSKKAIESKVKVQGQPAKAAIFGYKSTGEKGARRWIVHEQNAILLRRLFETFATGQYGSREIAAYAHDVLAITNPKTNRPYRHNTIISWLRNIEYTGIILLKGEKILGKYVSIVPSKLFYKVQEVFKNKSVPKSAHSEYAYTGMIECSYCGKLLSGTSKKGQVYYRCGKKHLPCKGVARKYLNEEVLTKEIIGELAKVEIDEGRWQLLSDYLRVLSSKDQIRIKSEIRKSRNIIAQENENIKKYNKAVIEKEIKRKYADGLIGDAEGRIDAVTGVLSKMENLERDLGNMLDDFLDDLKHVFSRFETASPTNRRTIIDTFCENLLWDDQKLSWDWKRPYLYLAKVKNQKKMLRVLDSNQQPVD